MPVTLRFQSTGVVPGNARPAVVQGGTLTIGRAPENDLVLPDPDRQISKQHCVVEDRNGEVVVIDFSSNGTFLNYAKVPLGRVPTPLSDGDILTMGAFELLVSITAGAGPSRAGQMIADPLPDPLAGAVGPGLLPPLEEVALPVTAGGNLPPEAEEVDFLDSLLGPEGPKGPSGVSRPQLGDDGLLPPDGEDMSGLMDPSGAPDAPSAAPSAAASRYEHQEGLRDHFAAPQSLSSIPDDWDDLLEDPAPGAAPGGDQILPAPAVSAEVTALTRDPFAEAGDPPPPEAPDPEVQQAASAELAVSAPPDLPPVPEGLAGEDVSPAGALSAASPDPVPAASSEGDAGSAALLQAFLTGLGAPGLQIAPEEAAATMERLGRAMRAMITGLREVLMTRASIKQEFRIGQTVIAAGGNNPLKFSISPELAIEAMVRPTARGWLPADLSAEQALQDLKAHEVAMMTGMEAALKDLLRRLDPAVLEGRLEAQSGLGSFLKGRKARYWELYETLYAGIADQAENEFQELFAREFAQAYRDQLERLK